jgi:putative acyl-CoA dehydrogenase
VDAEPDAVAASARWLVERAAVVLQASLLARFSPADVSDDFVATRVRGAGGLTFGTWHVEPAAAARILERAVRT